ncbi:MAG: hypothetical protein R3240_00050 [Gammaproteobacteria bacterium]|nr:hypothetical protein [Gammaproteobacteria bacterium]
MAQFKEVTPETDDRRYVILHSNNRTGHIIGLMEQVNAYIEHGYAPIGGITILPTPDQDTVFSQAVFKIGNVVRKELSPAKVADGQVQVGSTKIDLSDKNPAAGAGKNPVKPTVNLSKGVQSGTKQPTRPNKSSNSGKGK